MELDIDMWIQTVRFKQKPRDIWKFLFSDEAGWLVLLAKTGSVSNKVYKQEKVEEHPGNVSGMNGNFRGSDYEKRLLFTGIHCDNKRKVNMKASWKGHHRKREEEKQRSEILIYKVTEN